MIHKYKQLGLNIVMDVYSGAVHVVDDVMYDMLDYTLEPFMAEAKCPDYIKEGLKDKYSEEELEESYAEICALVNAGQLFTDDCYDEIAKNWNKQSVVKALCIHVAHDCNLRCKYCFADTGEFHGGRSLMSAEVGKKAIDFVINNSGNRKNIEIDYFGGEPLMNFGVVKEITEYAKEEAKKHGKNFRFTVTTNGVLLNDDIKQYINENMSNVVLSIDGTKETNDRMRYRVDGSGMWFTSFLTFDGKLSDDLYKICAVSPYLFVPASEGAWFQEWIDRIIDSHFLKNDIDDAALSVGCFEFLTRLSQLRTGLSRTEHPLYLQYVRPAMQEIESHLSDPLNVDDLAEQLHITPQYLTRLFQRFVGSSVRSYISVLRISRAKDSLSSS